MIIILLNLRFLSVKSAGKKFSSAHCNTKLPREGNVDRYSPLSERWSQTAVLNSINNYPIQMIIILLNLRLLSVKSAGKKFRSAHCNTELPREGNGDRYSPLLERWSQTAVLNSINNYPIQMIIILLNLRLLSVKSAGKKIRSAHCNTELNSDRYSPLSERWSQTGVLNSINNYRIQMIIILLNLRLLSVKSAGKIKIGISSHVKSY